MGLFSSVLGVSLGGFDSLLGGEGGGLGGEAGNDGGSGSGSPGRRSVECCSGANFDFLAATTGGDCSENSDKSSSIGTIGAGDWFNRGVVGGVLGVDRREDGKEEKVAAELAGEMWAER
jgi:hypothetical protein